MSVWRYHLCAHATPLQTSDKVSSPTLMPQGLAHLHTCHQDKLDYTALARLRA